MKNIIVFNDGVVTAEMDQWPDNSNSQTDSDAYLPIGSWYLHTGDWYHVIKDESHWCRWTPDFEVPPEYRAIALLLT